MTMLFSLRGSLLALLFLAGLTATPAAAAEIQQEIDFRGDDGYDFGGILHLPSGDGPFPAVIVLHNAGAGWYEHLYMGTELPRTVEGTGWANEVAFEPWPVFSRVEVPVIAFYGENDPWIPIDDSIRIWRQAAREAGNDDLEVHRVARAGHAMVVDEAANMDDDDWAAATIAPDYERLMRDFVRRVALRKP